MSFGAGNNGFTSINSTANPGFVSIRPLLPSSTLETDVATLQSNVATAQGDITTLQSDVATAQGDITTLQSDITTITTYWYYTLVASGGSNPIPNNAIIGDQASSTNGIWTYQSFSTGSDISNTSGEFTFTTTGVYDIRLFLRLYQTSGSTVLIQIRVDINGIEEQRLRIGVENNVADVIQSSLYESITAGDKLRFYQNFVNTAVEIQCLKTNDANLVIRRIS